MHIQMISPHGLIRYKNPEIGSDRDTGGQVKYLVELLSEMRKNEKITKVDLITRYISDRRYSSDYSVKVENIDEKIRIIRVQCGGVKYRPKETLWPYLDEMVDNLIRFNREEEQVPDIVHGHYADGSYVAQQISIIYDMPMVMTGHSLGQYKLKMLEMEGVSGDDIDKKYNIKHRIKVEENAISHSRLVIASTENEIKTQYSYYNAAKSADFIINPPGYNSNVFYSYYKHTLPGSEMDIESEIAYNRMQNEIGKFLYEPGKPIILAIGRADKRKNFETIIKAYGNDKQLQTLANLVIFAGIRKDIRQMPQEECEVLTELLLLLDRYDLYGKLAIPKKNNSRTEIPEVYRIAALNKGVFINATRGENFGLTILEAAASGLPVIAPDAGGPKEIISQCSNGIVIDIDDDKKIAEAVKKIISDNALWQMYSENSIVNVFKHYSWKSHVDKYVNSLETLLQKDSEQNNKTERTSLSISVGRKFSNVKRVIITDIDDTLIGRENNEGLPEFIEYLNRVGEDTVFGLATGRNKQLTEDAITQHGLPQPDIMICSAGTEIYYGGNMILDKGWEKHISYLWKREKIINAMENMPALVMQEKEAQWDYKLSYYANKEFADDDIAEIYRLLDFYRLKAKVLFSEKSFIDFLPFRAGKGKAINYLSFKWHIPIEDFSVFGNSGNDEGMLMTKANATVVGNYSSELEKLKKNKKIYFAKESLANGILEGLKYFGSI